MLCTDECYVLFLVLHQRGNTLSYTLLARCSLSLSLSLCVCVCVHRSLPCCFLIWEMINWSQLLNRRPTLDDLTGLEDLILLKPARILWIKYVLHDGLISLYKVD